jgi:RNA recognition motif-containing protein
MGKKLYVGNLPFSATEDSLKEAFSRFGTVESVNIITDRYTGQSKGFGFIELSTKQEAAEAIGKPRDRGGSRGYGGGGRGGGGGGFRR